MFAGISAVGVVSLAQNEDSMGISTCNTEPSPSPIMTFVILGVLEPDRSAKSIFPPRKPAKYLLSWEEEDCLYKKENASHAQRNDMHSGTSI